MPTPLAAAASRWAAKKAVMPGSKSPGNTRKYTAAPAITNSSGPNQATANQGSDCRQGRGFSTQFRNPSRVTRRVSTTPRAGKNMVSATAAT